MTAAPCNTCRHYKPPNCMQPQLVQRFNGAMPAMTMRGFDENCAGRFWEKQGLFLSILTLLGLR